MKILFFVKIIIVFVFSLNLSSCFKKDKFLLNPYKTIQTTKNMDSTTLIDLLSYSALNKATIIVVVNYHSWLTDDNQEAVSLIINFCKTNNLKYKLVDSFSSEDYINIYLYK